MHSMKKISDGPLMMNVGICSMCAKQMLEMAERNVQDVWFNIRGLHHKSSGLNHSEVFPKMLIKALGK